MHGQFACPAIDCSWARGHNAAHLSATFSDEEDATPDQPIFFGGINVYLQHKFSLFRHTPKWLDKAFDNKYPLLRKVLLPAAG